MLRGMGQVLSEPERCSMAVPDAVLRAALDALPLMVFIVDEDVRINYMNAEAAALFEGQGDVSLQRLGQALHCIHAEDAPDGCGRGPACGDCYIRNAVGGCLLARHALREKTRFQRITTDGVSEGLFTVVATPLRVAGRDLAMLVLQDISELNALREIVPICAWCHRVRSSPNYWETVERYASEHLAIDWSHGICEECRDKFVASLPAKG